MTAPTLVRPNGKPYRPRKGLRTSPWEDEDWREPGYGAVVLGTLDPEVARPLAAQACSAWYEMGGAVDPRPGWWRLAMRNGERQWIEDEERGAPGVLFAAANEDEVDRCPCCDWALPGCRLDGAS